jgi:hypothetical protein
MGPVNGCDKDAVHKYKASDRVFDAWGVAEGDVRRVQVREQGGLVCGGCYSYDPAKVTGNKRGRPSKVCVVCLFEWVW